MKTSPPGVAIVATQARGDMFRAATRVAAVRAGGAEVIAALAYGTQTVPRVDKIVGPGNIFVTIAR